MAKKRGRARPSNVDKHAEKQAIEAQLCRNVPLRTLARKYNITIAALSRHRTRMKEQRPEAYKALVAADWACTPEELERVRTETRDNWIVVLKSQVDKLIGAQDAAFADERYAAGAQIAGQAHGALRMLGEASDQLSDGAARIAINQQTNLYSAEVFDFRTRVMEALRPFPDARAALVALKAETAPTPPTAVLEASAEVCAA